MEQVYITDQTFERTDYTNNPLPKGEYECCTFKNCDFSNSDLGDIRFIDCMLEGCNLSMAKFNKTTTFRDTKFINCKMLGLHFDNCNEMGLTVYFNNCSLNHSSFFKTKLKKTSFLNSRLIEVDFTECDLTGSVFDNCDFMGSTFDNTILEKTDFRTSFNYSINPELNRIKKARFSHTGLPGLLGKYDIEID